MAAKLEKNRDLTFGVFETLKAKLKTQQGVRLLYLGAKAIALRIDCRASAAFG
jgi:hypothetical protein